MKKRSRLGRALSILLAMLMILTNSAVTIYADIIGGVVQKNEDNSTDATFGTDYSLEYLLNHFNVVSFGNVEMNIHCMGAVLIKGDYSGNGDGFSDSANVEVPSYIGGYVSYRGYCNSRSAHGPIPLYVGTGNNITNNHRDLNGKPNYNQGADILATDTYVSWGNLEQAVKNTSASLPAYSIRTYDIQKNWQEIEVDAGTNVTVETNGYKTKIRLKGESTSATVINLPGNGTLEVPQITGTASTENGEDMPVVFNAPGASGVIIPNELTPEVGHIIAPYATIDMEDGNYNGCLVGQSMTINGEGHMWPYRGGSLIPASSGFKALKTVDGEEPDEDQKFKFILSELIQTDNGFTWNDIQNKENNKGTVTFDEIIYSTEDQIGDHWYCISEDQTQGALDYILSTVQYLVKVTVSLNVEGDNAVFDKEVSYFKIADSETGKETRDSISGPEGIQADKLQTLEKENQIIFDNSSARRHRGADPGYKKDQ